MHDGISRIALERLARVVELHPPVKRIVEKQIRQGRTDHPTLWGAFGPSLYRPIGSLKRSRYTARGSNFTF